MPSIQKRVVSVAEQIATLQARLTKLETFPTTGATVLASAASSTPITNLTNATDQYFSPATTPTFQLLRPVPMLAIASYTVGTSSLSVSLAEIATHVEITGDAGATLNAYAPYQTFYLAPNGGTSTSGFTPCASLLYMLPTQQQVNVVTNWSARLTGFVGAGSQSMQIYAWSIFVMQLAG